MPCRKGGYSHPTNIFKNIKSLVKLFIANHCIREPSRGKSSFLHCASQHKVILYIFSAFDYDLFTNFAVSELYDDFVLHSTFSVMFLDRHTGSRLLINGQKIKQNLEYWIDFF